MKRDWAAASVLRHGLTEHNQDAMPQWVYDDRLGEIRRSMADRGLDALFLYGDVFRPSSVAYVSNYAPWDDRREAVAVVTQAAARIFTNVTKRDISSIERWTALPVMAVSNLSAVTKTDEWEEMMRPVKRSAAVGVAGRCNIFSGHSTTTGPIPWEGPVKDVDDMVSTALRHKDARSTYFVECAGKIAHEALCTMRRAACPGLRELELSALGDYAARIRGCRDVHVMFSVGGDSIDTMFRGGEQQLPESGELRMYVAVQYHGYWAEAGESVSLGSPDGIHEELRIRVQAATASLPAVVRAGGVLRSPGGCRVLWAHGIGLDRWEEPDYTDGEPFALGDTVSIGLVAGDRGREFFIGRTMAVGRDSGRDLCVGLDAVLA